MDGRVILRVENPTRQVIEWMLAAVDASTSSERGSLSLGGAAFDVLVVDVRLDSTYDGEVLVVEGHITPARETGERDGG